MNIDEIAGERAPALSGAQASSMAAEEARQIAQVQGAMTLAQKFPRNERAATARILDTCAVIEFADEADYSYKRGQTQVSGASIRLLEECARQWGNIEYSVAEVARGEKESLAQTYAVDLQTNVWSRRQFVVPHRRDVSEGAKELKSDRDVYEIIANMGSRRVRACLEQLIPAYIVQAARDKCADVRANRDQKEPLVDRIGKLLLAFASHHKVTEAQVSKWAQRPAREMLENEFQNLRSIFFAIKNGVARIDEHFEPASVADSLTPKKTGSAGAGPRAPGADGGGSPPARSGNPGAGADARAANQPVDGAESAGQPARNERVGQAGKDAAVAAGGGTGQPSAAQPAADVGAAGAEPAATKTADDDWAFNDETGEVVPKDEVKQPDTLSAKDQILKEIEAATDVEQINALKSRQQALEKQEDRKACAMAGMRKVRDLAAASSARRANGGQS